MVQTIQIRSHANSFSYAEIKDLAKSFIILGLAFTIAQLGLALDAQFMIVLIISLLTAGIGFVLHELAHKFAAQNYGCFSEFRANNSMLVVALLFSFVGFIFAAPGAVMIQGSITKRQYGVISAVGPATNFALAILFLIPLIAGSGIIQLIGLIGFSINAWIGLFNLIPVLPFDGAKILAWDKAVYAVMVAIGIVAVIVSFML